MNSIGLSAMYYVRHEKVLLSGLMLLYLAMLFIMYRITSHRNVGMMTRDGFEEGECLPQHHVIFIKNHKCGSSTVMNILLRYGYNNHLTFALPETTIYLGHPDLFKANMVSKDLLPPGEKADIFTLHTRLNIPEHSRVAHNDTIWVTIVRDPVSLFESLYSYYGMQEAYGLNISEYSKQPLSKLRSLPRFIRKKFGKNQMLFDLGYPDNLNVTEVGEAIVEVDDLFDLVMVSEYMDESLVLLRHLLCWSLHDIIGFTMNVRRQEVKAVLEPETVKTLRELNSADVLLYDHFLAQHRQAVVEFGVKRMADEVSAIQTLRDEYYRQCGTLAVEGRHPSLKVKEYSGLVNTYVPAKNSSQYCELLTMPMVQLIQTVKDRQRQMYSNL